MCVHMCVCAARTRVFVYVACVYVRASMHVCVCTCVRACVRACVCVCARARARVCVCARYRTKRPATALIRLIFHVLGKQIKTKKQVTFFECLPVLARLRIAQQDTNC